MDEIQTIHRVSMFKIGGVTCRSRLMVRFVHFMSYIKVICLLHRLQLKETI